QLVHQGWTKRSPNTIENDIATRGPGCPAKSLLPSGVAGANNLAPEVWVRHCSSRRSARRTYRLYVSVVQLLSQLARDRLGGVRDRNVLHLACAQTRHHEKWDQRYYIVNTGQIDGDRLWHWLLT